MPADDKPWSTSYPTAQDQVGVEQGDLLNDSTPGSLDGHRALVSHVHALRDKLQAVCNKVGDDGLSPAGCLADILDTDGTDANQIRLAERTTKPTPVAGKGFLYTKDVTGSTKLFYEDAAGVEVDISSGGASSLDEAYQGGGDVTVDGNPVTLNRTQTADDQESLEISHDFNENQGTAIVITGANTGGGTPVGEAICAVSASIVKKVPETYYYYVLSSSVVKRKIGEGEWTPLSLPDSPNDLEKIHGSAIDNVWIAGESSGNGYIAVDTGSGFATVNSHPTYGTHPFFGQPVGNSQCGLSVFATDDIWTHFVTGAGDFHLHHWDGVSWTEKYHFNGSPALLGSVVKVGNCYAIRQGGPKLHYSLDGGDTWSVEDHTSGSPLGTYTAELMTNASTGRLRVASYKDFGAGYNTIRVHEGLPEGTGADAWTLIGEYDRGATTNLYQKTWSTGAYADENGATFVLGVGSEHYFIYGFDSTPTKIDLGLVYPNNLHGTSENNVAWSDGIHDFHIWNGSTVSTEDPDVMSMVSVLCLSSTTGEANFSTYKSEFSGSAEGSTAAAYEVGVGATHALKAATGDIELDSGVIILGKQIETPATPTAKGVIYTKEVSGETEFFYLDTVGNEVQLSNGGTIAIPVPLELAQTQTADDQESLEISHDFDDNQGAVFKITGSNTGAGTSDGEAIRALTVSMPKKMPSVITQFIGDSWSSGDVWKRIDTGTPAKSDSTAQSIRHVDGLGANVIWAVGFLGSATGFIAKTDDGGSNWTINPDTHPHHGVNNRCILHVLVVSSTEVYTVTENTTITQRSVHKWNGSSWSELLAFTSSFGRPHGGAVVGTTLLYGTETGMCYATDIYGTPSWTLADTTNGSRTHCALDSDANAFVIASVNQTANHIKVWRGSPGAWTLVLDHELTSVSFAPVEYGYYFGGSAVWVSSSGKIYISCYTGSPDWYLFREDGGSATELYHGPLSFGCISGASDDFILMGSSGGSNTGSFFQWDGVSLTEVEVEPASSAQTCQPYAYAGISGTATFGIVRGEFTGSATDSSVAYLIEGGGGITHVIKAQTGDIELDSGVIILGEQSETPATPTNKGVIYTKEVSGETEFFYLDTAGNEVQLSNGGTIAIPVPLELAQTQTADNQETLEITHDFDDNQGSVVRITGNNTGNGTISGESIRISDSTITKKIPTLDTWITVGQAALKSSKKEGEGAWGPVSGFPTVGDYAYAIRGLDGNNVWATVYTTSSRRGYLFKFDGVDWSEDTTFWDAYGGLGLRRSVEDMHIDASGIYIVSRDTAYSYHRMHIDVGDFAGNWVDKDPADSIMRSTLRIAKLGTKVLILCRASIRYTEDITVASPVWTDYTDFLAPVSGNAYGYAVAADTENNRFILGITATFVDDLGNPRFRAYHGFPGSWTELARYTDELVSTSGLGLQDIYVTSLGEVSTVLDHQTYTPRSRLIQAIETGTPVAVDLEDAAYTRLSGLNSQNIMMGYGTSGMISHWNGVTVTNENTNVGTTTVNHVYAATVATGTATFGGHKMSFTGQDIPNEAVAYEVGTGATHAVKAQTGDIELDSGVIILGEQSETPATPTNKGVIYTKEVSGETEFFYLDTVGNEVQLTSNGYVVAGVTVIEDTFSDSSIHSRWTVDTPGSSTAVEGSDGIVLTPDGDDDPSLELTLPSDMALRNWVMQVHCTFAFTGSPGDTGGGIMRITGKGGGAAKWFQSLVTGGTGPTYSFAMEDTASSQTTTGSTTMWMRMRRFGDEIRVDYYDGAHTVDVDADGQWVEHDSSKTWYVVPKSGTYDYPIVYETLKLYAGQWTGNPGIEVTFRNFKLRLF